MFDSDIELINTMGLVVGDTISSRQDLPNGAWAEIKHTLLWYGKEVAVWACSARDHKRQEWTVPFEFSGPVVNCYSQWVKEPSGPVLTEKGEVEQFTPRINGKLFRCSCGCNVFHKPNRLKPELYECNCCEAQYEAS